MAFLVSLVAKLATSILLLIVIVATHYTKLLFYVCYLMLCEHILILMALMCWHGFI